MKPEETAESHQTLFTQIVYCSQRRVANEINTTCTRLAKWYLVQFQHSCAPVMLIGIEAEVMTVCIQLLR